MNMPCSSSEDMIEVTCKVFGSTATETIPFPPLRLYFNVTDYLTISGTLKYFELGHKLLTERFMADEVTAYVIAMKNVVHLAQRKNLLQEKSSPLRSRIPLETRTEISLPRDGDRVCLCFHIVATNLRISATTWHPCETSSSNFRIQHCQRFSSEVSGFSRP